MKRVVILTYFALTFTLEMSVGAGNRVRDAGSDISPVGTL